MCKLVDLIFSSGIFPNEFNPFLSCSLEHRSQTRFN